MIVQYKFQIQGILRVESSFSFRFHNRTYSFETNDGVASALLLSIKGFNADLYAPLISQNESHEITTHVRVKEPPDIAFIQIELRTLEGLLATFGVYEINILEYEISWIAETQDEKKKIKIRNYKRGYEKKKYEDLPLVPLDIFQRAILASMSTFDKDIDQLQVPLTFFRKGRHDLSQKRFLDASYDFYFMVETLFADGKHGTKDVKALYKANTQLIFCINRVIQDEYRMSVLNGISPEKFKKFIYAKNVAEILDYVVELRGAIHHHTLKKMKWDPSRDFEFEFEAYLLSFIAESIGLDLTFQSLDEHNDRKNDVEIFRKVSQ